MNGQDTGSKVNCWDCDGTGLIFLPFRPDPPMTLKCERCAGTGFCLKSMIKWKQEGFSLKEKRIGLKVTLKKACEIWGIDL